jgi:serine/threonine protein kinase
MEARAVPELHPDTLGDSIMGPAIRTIPGYRLIEPLGSGGFGEVWKCEAPGGICKALKVVHGYGSACGGDAGNVEQELLALQRVKDIRHPFIVSLDRVEIIDGDLVIVMELADQSLYDRLRECRQAGLPGIPREELLCYLSEAAEALDVMNQRHGLQHLDIKPHNLFLVHHHVKVADFGLVQDLNRHAGDGEGEPLGGVTPAYSAPEIFQGRPSAHSDQYSLAITYQELLTGTRPFTGKNSHQLALQHLQAPPALDSLPPADRPIVARALAKDPKQRFPSCMDFLHALVTGQPLPPPAPAARTPLTASRIIRRLPAADRPASAPSPPETLPAGGVPTLPAGLPLGWNELLPGYRFLGCLARSSLHEIWKVADDQGRERSVRVYFGCATDGVPADPGAVLRLQALAHPAVPPIDSVQLEGSRLIVVTAPVEQTLWDLFRRHRAEQRDGIPRDELLGHLETAAEALDQLAEQYEVCHLTLNPRSLLLTGDRLGLADMGIAQWFWLPAGQSVAQFNLRYAAPEMFEGRFHPATDQYSLAIIFLELLTGTHPLRGQSLRQPVSSRLRRRQDLDLVPAPDRAALARALDLDPDRRFPSCRAFVAALPRAPTRGRIDPPSSASLVLGTAARPVPKTASPQEVARVVTALLKAAAGDWQVHESNGIRYLQRPGEIIQHRCSAHLPAALAGHKLEGFRQQWQARLARQDATTFVFQIEPPANFWQRCLGKRPALAIEVRLDPPSSPTLPTDIAIQITPSGYGPREADQLLRDVGPPLLESLRLYLQAHPERRSEERLLWHPPLEVYPVEGDLAGEVIRCRGKDISLHGIGLYLPQEPPTTRIVVQFPGTLLSEPADIPAKIVRVCPHKDGWHEVGALFLTDGSAA